jgi:hypothetical protein
MRARAVRGGNTTIRERRAVSSKMPAKHAWRAACCAGDQVALADSELVTACATDAARIAPAASFPSTFR